MLKKSCSTCYTTFLKQTLVIFLLQYIYACNTKFLKQTLVAPRLKFQSNPFVTLSLEKVTKTQNTVLVRKYKSLFAATPLREKQSEKNKSTTLARQGEINHRVCVCGGSVCGCVNERERETSILSFSTSVWPPSQSSPKMATVIFSRLYIVTLFSEWLSFPVFYPTPSQRLFSFACFPANRNPSPICYW